MSYWRKWYNIRLLLTKTTDNFVSLFSAAIKIHQRMNICTNGNMFLDFWFSIHLSSSSHVLKPSHRIYWSSKVTYYFTPMQVLTWQGIYIHVKSKSVKCKLSKYFLHLKTVNRPHEEIFSISWSKKWFIVSLLNNVIKIWCNCVFRS